MKKLTYLAVAVIAVLSSCSSDDALNGGTSSIGGTMEFTATAEGDVSSRSTLSGKTQSWEAGDVISINGTDYTAASAGTSTTFTGETVDKDNGKYKAYFPKTMYSSGTISLPATYTYSDGKCNMPMYAESSDNNLAFKNLTGVIALTVPSTQMTTVTNITVYSDQHICGACTIDYNSGAPTITWTNETATTAEQKLKIDCGTGVTVASEGTVFYIPVPVGSHILAFAVAGTYNSTETTKKMTAKKAITIARNGLYTLTFNQAIPDYTKDYVLIGGVKWAQYNVGATTISGSQATCSGDYYAWSETEPRYNSLIIYGSTCAWDGWKSGFPNGYIEPYPTYSGTTLDAAHDVATQKWGEYWRMPTAAEYQALCQACTGSTSTYSNLPDLSSSTPAGGIYWLEADQSYLSEYSGVAGFLFVDQKDTSKRLFFPAAGYWHNDAAHGSYVNNGIQGVYWSATNDTGNTNNANFLFCLHNSKHINPKAGNLKYFCLSIRAVV